MPFVPLFNNAVDDIYSKIGSFLDGIDSWKKVYTISVFFDTCHELFKWVLKRILGACKVSGNAIGPLYR